MDDELENDELENDKLENDELDDQWIYDFKLNDIVNDEFINCDNDNISMLNIYNIYVNNNILSDVSNETVKIYDDILNRNDIIKLIKKNSIYNDKNYKLYFLLKFNVDISYEYLNNFLDNNFEDNLLNHIEEFLLDGKNGNNGVTSKDGRANDLSCFFSICKDISDIAFNYEVAFLRKLASLYFIYFEKTDSKYVEYIPALKIPYYTDKKKRMTKNNRYNKFKSLGSHGNNISDANKKYGGKKLSRKNL